MAQEFSDEEIARLDGQRLWEDFSRAGQGPWTVLYNSEDIHKRPSSTAVYSVLAPPALRSKFLRETNWDVHIGHGQPGTLTSFGDSPASTYVPFGNDEGWEPLVIVTDAAGSREGEVLFSQEFRLVFELFEDQGTGNLVDVLDDGTESVVVQISRDKVVVRSSYLARFRALKQMDLWLYTDTHTHLQGVGPVDNLEDFHEDWKTEESIGSNRVGTLLGYPSATFTAKTFLSPPPIERCNLWDYEDRLQTYEDFIIGEDEFGRPISFTCEEGKLANYFGKNPDAPHYLTPVFFRSDVLQKYYNNTELYVVSEGSVSCKALWHLRLDNDHSEYVAVFLGDLGRDLPASERQYWKGFNIVPTGSMSETYFRRSYLGQWVDAEQPDHRFKHAYTRLQSSWRHDHGWTLYREPHDADQSHLARLHVPLNETQTEFEDQLLTLAKLLVDFLNEKAIVRAIGPGPENERGIGKLQRFLVQAGYDRTEDDISLLRLIQELRSKVTAHSKGSGYDAYIASKLERNTKREFVRELHQRTTEMLMRWTELSSSVAALDSEQRPPEQAHAIK
ncbi:hypothetical protein ABDK96_07270 [Citricoccus nitrophenolicus]|uniref:ApeA N-terminal domain-containing protein n=1 Tax=Citricoccus nitrophenolicus TaxID=863575 RepID=A0ABV0IHB2_9MICC